MECIECIECKKRMKYGGGKKGTEYQSLHTSGQWKQQIYLCNSCVVDLINNYNKRS